jgi:hypothetical protein
MKVELPLRRIWTRLSRRSILRRQRPDGSRPLFLRLSLNSVERFGWCILTSTRNLSSNCTAHRAFGQRHVPTSSELASVNATMPAH